SQETSIDQFAQALLGNTVLALDFFFGLGQPAAAAADEAALAQSSDAPALARRSDRGERAVVEVLQYSLKLAFAAQVGFGNLEAGGRAAGLSRVHQVLNVLAHQLELHGLDLVSLYGFVTVTPTRKKREDSLQCVFAITERSRVKRRVLQ